MAMEFHGQRQALALQGYLTHKNPPPQLEPTVALSIGPYGDPKGVSVSDERGTLVIWLCLARSGRIKERDFFIDNLLVRIH